MYSEFLNEFSLMKLGDQIIQIKYALNTDMNMIWFKKSGYNTNTIHYGQKYNVFISGQPYQSLVNPRETSGFFGTQLGILPSNQKLNNVRP